MVNLFPPFSCPFLYHPPASDQICPLSLHDALPISLVPGAVGGSLPGWRVRVLEAISDEPAPVGAYGRVGDRKSTRLNSSHVAISYAVFCLKKKKTTINHRYRCRR